MRDEASNTVTATQWGILSIEGFLQNYVFYSNYAPFFSHVLHSHTFAGSIYFSFGLKAIISKYTDHNSST